MTNKPSSPTPHSVCFLTSIRSRRHHKRYKLQYNHFPVSMLCLITQGKGTVLIDQKRYQFEPQQLYYLTPGMNIELSVESENLAYYSLELEHYVGSQASPPVAGSHKRLNLHGTDTPLFPLGLIPIRKSNTLLHKVQQLYEDSLQRNDPFKHHLQFQELLLTIMEHSTEQQPTEFPAAQGIEQALAYMQTHLDEQLEMKTLSKMAGLTASSFSRLFKKTVGETPVAYLSRLRMDNAKELLGQQDCRIKEVSKAVGYEDEFYFSRVFHRTVGVSPTLYMKRNRMRIAVASCTRFHDNLLSLGIEPVASINCCRYPGMSDAEYEHLLAAQWEELARAQPDLIIGDRYHQGFHHQFNKLAASSILLTSPDWLVNYRKLSSMLGRHQEAEATLNQLALRVTSARRMLHHSMENKTVSVMQVTHACVRIHGTVNHPLNELIYHDLGLKPGRNVPLNSLSLEIQPEWLPPLEADYVFVLQKNVRAGSEAIYERMRRTHAWNSIQAVQSNQVRPIPQWVRMSWTPNGRAAIIDEILSITGTEHTSS